MPNDGVVGQASPKDARDRHAVMRVIDLVFCPLNNIELVSLNTNETMNRSCKILQELSLTLIANRSSIELFASLRVFAFFARNIVSQWRNIGGNNGFRAKPPRSAKNAKFQALDLRLDRLPRLPPAPSVPFNEASGHKRYSIFASPAPTTASTTSADGL